MIWWATQCTAISEGMQLRTERVLCASATTTQSILECEASWISDCIYTLSCPLISISWLTNIAHRIFFARVNFGERLPTVLVIWYRALPRNTMQIIGDLAQYYFISCRAGVEQSGEQSLARQRTKCTTSSYNTFIHAGCAISPTGRGRLPIILGGRTFCHNVYDRTSQSLWRSVWEINCKSCA